MTSSNNSGSNPSPFGGVAQPSPMQPSGSFRASTQREAEAMGSYFGGPSMPVQDMFEPDVQNASYLQNLGLSASQQNLIGKLTYGTHTSYSVAERSAYIQRHLAQFQNPGQAANAFIQRYGQDNTSAIVGELQMAQYLITGDALRYSGVSYAGDPGDILAYAQRLSQYVPGGFDTATVAEVINTQDYLVSAVMAQAGKLQVASTGGVSYMPSRQQLATYIGNITQDMGLPESVPIVGGSLVGDQGLITHLSQGVAQVSQRVANVAQDVMQGDTSAASIFENVQSTGGGGGRMSYLDVVARESMDNDDGYGGGYGGGDGGGGGYGGGGGGGGGGGYGGGGGAESNREAMARFIQAIVQATQSLNSFQQQASQAGNALGIEGPAAAPVPPSVSEGGGVTPRAARQLAQREYRLFDRLMSQFDDEGNELPNSGGRMVGGFFAGLGRGAIGLGQFQSDTASARLGNLAMQGVRGGLNAVGAIAGIGGVGTGIGGLVSFGMNALNKYADFGASGSFIEGVAGMNLTGLGKVAAPQLAALQGLATSATEVELRTLQATAGLSLMGYGAVSNAKFNTIGGMGQNVMQLSEQLGIAPGAAAEMLRATYSTGGGAGLSAGDLAKLTSIGLNPAQIAGITAQNLNYGLTGGANTQDLVVSAMRQGFSGERAVQMAEVAGNFARQRAAAGLQARDVSDVYQQMLAMSRKGGTSMMHAATVLGKGQEVGGAASMSILGSIGAVSQQAMFAQAFTQTGSLTGAMDLLRNSTPEQQQALLGGMGITGELQGIFLRTTGYTQKDIQSFTGDRAELTTGLSSVEAPGQALRVSRAATLGERSKLRDIYQGPKSEDVIGRIEAVMESSAKFQTALVQEAGLTREQIKQVADALIDINKTVRDNLTGLLTKELALLRSLIAGDTAAARTNTTVRRASKAGTTTSQGRPNMK